MALTDTEIKRVKPRERPFKRSDSGGLYLWVTPAGSKLWRWTYRHSGKQKVMTFGRYPEISLARARERHAEERRRLAEGTDPMAHRKAEKQAERIACENSFSSMANRWLEHWQGERAPGMLIQRDTGLPPISFPALAHDPCQKSKLPRWSRWFA